MDYLVQRFIQVIFQKRGNTQKRRNLKFRVKISGLFSSTVLFKFFSEKKPSVDFGHKTALLNRIWRSTKVISKYVI